MASPMSTARRPTAGRRPRDSRRSTRWLGDGKWDVIHFNWGLHDLKYVKPGSDNLAEVAAEGSRQQVPLPEYQANLEKLVERLKQTGAKLIWRTTTPVPAGAGGRVPGDAARYNAAALEIMRRHGIAIDDMYAYSMPRLEDRSDIQTKRTKPGLERIARQAAGSLSGPRLNPHAARRDRPMRISPTPAPNARSSE